MTLRLEESIHWNILLTLYMALILLVHLTSFLLSGKNTFKYALGSLACNQNLYLTIFHTSNLLCVNCLFLRWFAL